MENQENAPDKSTELEWIRSLPRFIMSYLSGVITRPLQNGLIYFLAGLLPALFIGWVLFPMVIYSKQPQPINFSHDLHMDPEVVEGIDKKTEPERCLYCHSIHDDGTFAGIPKLERCMECHDDPESPLGESIAEEKLMREYVAHNKEIPWLIYYRQPDCVYFSHLPHIKAEMGNLSCRTCHGNHSKTHLLPDYKRNRLSGYSINIWGKRISGLKNNTWDRMKMDDCAQCHTEKGREENNACFVCHK